MREKLNPFFYFLSLVCFAFVLINSTNAEETDSCDDIQRRFPDGLTDQHGQSYFAYRENLAYLTQLSGNDGNHTIDGLESYYLELEARIELAMFLGHEVRIWEDSKGNDYSVSKLDLNPFDLMLERALICQYNDPEPVLFFLGRLP